MDIKLLMPTLVVNRQLLVMILQKTIAQQEKKNSRVTTRCVLHFGMMLKIAIARAVFATITSSRTVPVKLGDFLKGIEFFF